MSMTKNSQAYADWMLSQDDAEHGPKHVVTSLVKQVAEQKERDEFCLEVELRRFAERHGAGELNRVINGFVQGGRQ